MELLSMPSIRPSSTLCCRASWDELFKRVSGADTLHESRDAAHRIGQYGHSNTRSMGRDGKFPFRVVVYICLGALYNYSDNFMFACSLTFRTVLHVFGDI